MKRRSSIALLALAAATLAGGCTTFSDDNVAIRVDDTSYSHEQFNDLAVAAGLSEGQLDDIPGQGQPGLRRFATDLVLVGAIGSWLDDAGLGITDADADAGRLEAEQRIPGLSDLDADDQTVFAEFFAVIARADSTPDLQASLIQALDDADIYIDPRIGIFDADVGTVVALG